MDYKKRLLPWKAQLSPWQAFVSFFLEEREYFHFIIKVGIKRSLIAVVLILFAKHDQLRLFFLVICQGHKNSSGQRPAMGHSWTEALSFPLGYQDRQFATWR